MSGGGQYKLQREWRAIVCTPEDAFRCFMGTEIEVLFIGNCRLEKDDQDPALKLDYTEAFELD